MIQIYKRCFVFLAIFTGASFLSACSGIKSLAPSLHSSTAPSTVSHTDKITSPVSTAEDFPKVIPFSSESEVCLQRELDALRHTGIWENGVQPPADLKFGGIIHYDFPVVMNKQVEMYIKFFQHDERRTFSNWLSRSRRYLPMIQKNLKAAGLPLDLAYLAMIESGFNQKAYSSSRATGLWQFMRGTARDYNLRINGYVDERRNAEKSTKAAVAMLSDLYHQFGDWNLSVAAYNAGAGKIRAGLRRYHVKTFWALARKHYLSLETVRYVPKLMAAIIIAKDPEKYGFGNIKYLPPLDYDTLKVGPGMGLEAIALVTHSSKAKIQRLNPELIAGRTPWNGRKYEIKIPAGTQEMARSNLPRLQSVVRTQYRTHVLRSHESLASICKKYHISKKTLLQANSFGKGRLIAGQRLRIPIKTAHYILLAENSRRSARNHDLILHKVRAGETIVHIARQYHLRPALIMAWNNIKNARNLRIGKDLVLYVSGRKKQSHRIIAAVKNDRVMVPSHNPSTVGPFVLAAHKKNQPEQTAQETFKYYKIESGDTLWTISQKFNTTPEQIKIWNNLKSNLIHPGDKLKVKETSQNQIVAERTDNTVL